MGNLQHPLLHFGASGFGFYECCVRKKRINFHKYRAVNGDSDSEFEFDVDKARDALRKLDQQMDLLSHKHSNSLPKNKASTSSPYNLRDEVTKDVEDPGGFLPYAFFGLLVFTIVYNIVFIKVIKPSIDGPQELSVVPSSIMEQILKDE